MQIHHADAGRALIADEHKAVVRRYRNRDRSAAAIVDVSENRVPLARNHPRRVEEGHAVAAGSNQKLSVVTKHQAHRRRVEGDAAKGAQLSAVAPQDCDGARFARALPHQRNIDGAAIGAWDRCEGMGGKRSGQNCRLHGIAAIGSGNGLGCKNQQSRETRKRNLFVSHSV